MKNASIFIAAVLLLLSSSCSKEQKEPQPKEPFWFYNGTLNSLRNGKARTLKVIASFDTAKINPTISIGFVDYHDEATWDAISVSKLVIGEGSYLLEDYNIAKNATDSATKNSVAAHYNGSFGHGSDHIMFNYLAKDRPHFISVSSYNSTTHVLKGSLSFTFRPDEKFAPPGTKDSVSYTDATFEVKVLTQEEVIKLQNL